VLAVSNSTELRRQIRYLKAENEVLRSRIAGPVRVTPAERTRLVNLAKPVGRAVGELVSIVKPDTMLRWLNGSRPK
jgi:putative transposase